MVFHAQVNFGSSLVSQTRAQRKNFSEKKRAKELRCSWKAKQTGVNKHRNHSTIMPLGPVCLCSDAYVKTVDTTPDLPNTDKHSFIIILAATNTARTTTTTHI